MFVAVCVWSKQGMFSVLLLTGLLATQGEGLEEGQPAEPRGGSHLVRVNKQTPNKGGIIDVE